MSDPTLRRLRRNPVLRAAVALVVALIAIAACSGGDSDNENLSDLTVAPLFPAGIGDDIEELTVTDVIEGTGPEAVTADRLRAQYSGFLLDGTEFDSSWSRGGEPLDFQIGVGNVIAGWDQGLVGMQVGGRRILEIPAELAYGDAGAGALIGPGDDLVFVVDLVEILPAPTPTPPPPTSPPIPEEALGAVSQLEMIELTEGTGREAATGDILAIQYVGVDATEGAELDSSYARGGDAFRLILGRSAVIEGWTQGLAGMKVGGERILRVPANLAFDTDDLVYRVRLDELIEAPLGHLIEIEGEPPTETQTSTLLEGSGPASTVGDTLETELVTWYWRSDTLISSSYEREQTQTILLEAENMLPGLIDSIVGMRAGEIRRIDVPSSAAFPDGIPEGAGIDEDDAVIFVIEALSIS